MLYLVVIIDWYSSYALSWEIKDSIEIDFVLEACKTALKDVKTEIMNSVHGSDRAPNLGLVERFNFGLLPRFNLSLVARFNFGLPT